MCWTFVRHVSSLFYRVICVLTDLICSIAGSETTAITISYTLFELARRPDVALRLRRELDEAMPDPSKLPDISRLQEMEYLNAVIREGKAWPFLLSEYTSNYNALALRIYTSGPSPLERVAPGHSIGHNTASKAFTLLGYEIPEGTVIATQAWSSHRRPEVFWRPDVFMPKRWLLYKEFGVGRETPVGKMREDERARKKDKEGDQGSPTPTIVEGGSSVEDELEADEKVESPSPTVKKIAEPIPIALPSLPFLTHKPPRRSLESEHSEMLAHMFPFGVGPRSCGGQNLAMLVIRSAVASLVRNFDVEIPEEIGEREMERRMEIKDAFVIFPAAMECRLVFVPRG